MQPSGKGHAFHEMESRSQAVKILRDMTISP